ncbi:MAG TPA: hypothetical protein VHK69_22310 [Chitinophagaceae bacterium]|jgi:hypothetical protein|nr:hypothetical protein [Chitinophagaceae bacterium]
MKRTGIFLIVAFFVCSSTVMAQDYKRALGIRLSSNDAVVNNSISYKHFFGTTAAEVMLSFGKPGALGLMLEKHNPLGATGLNWYYGAGAYIGFNKAHVLGMQGALGLDYKIPSIPFNLSVDWKPELNLLDKLFFEPSAVGLSARFTF